MAKEQWILIITFAASWYDVGTIWMTQLGWRLWTYVAPDDFDAYHHAWWAKIKPVIFPVAALAFTGSIALIWWRPEGVTAASVWLNLGLQVLTYVLTAAFWARWQAQTHHAKLPDGSLDPMYARAMGTHWIRAVIITANGLAVLRMLMDHLSRGE
jgi:hypothetical protein